MAVFSHRVIHSVNQWVAKWQSVASTSGTVRKIQERERDGQVPREGGRGGWSDELAPQPAGLRVR